jgi:sterol desaturase/sphingolipid hydroxylase (fatty acid hydroxylase superfamily)
MPFAGRSILAFLSLDLAKYAIHRAFHSVSFLWRVHRVHHSDPDFDVSTSVQVHPIEAPDSSFGGNRGTELW